jgi:hypothetical protein
MGRLDSFLPKNRTPYRVGFQVEVSSIAVCTPTSRLPVGGSVPSRAAAEIFAFKDVGSIESSSARFGTRLASRLARTAGVSYEQEATPATSERPPIVVTGASGDARRRRAFIGRQLGPPIPFSPIGSVRPGDAREAAAARGGGTARRLQRYEASGPPFPPLQARVLKLERAPSPRRRGRRPRTPEDPGRARRAATATLACPAGNGADTRQTVPRKQPHRTRHRQ